MNNKLLLLIIIIIITLYIIMYNITCFFVTKTHFSISPTFVTHNTP